MMFSAPMRNDKCVTGAVVVCAMFINSGLYDLIDVWPMYGVRLSWEMGLCKAGDGAAAAAAAVVAAVVDLLWTNC